MGAQNMMLRFGPRVVAFVMVSCLMADTALASALPYPLAWSAHVFDSVSTFDTEALQLDLVFAPLKNLSDKLFGARQRKKASLVKSSLAITEDSKEVMVERSTHLLITSTVDPEQIRLIEKFLKAEMSSEERLAFVIRLQSDDALREATINWRARLDVEEMPASEKASDLFRSASHAFIGGNHIFPGDPYISGMENRRDIGPQRHQHYTYALENCHQLLAMHEMEDLAIENIRRLEHNLKSGDEAAKMYGPSSDGSAVRGMLVTVARRSLGASLTTRLAPAYAPPRNRSAEPSLQELLTLPVNDRQRRKLLFRLWEAVPDDWYYMPEKMTLPLQEEERLIQQLDRDPELIPALMDFARTNVQYSDPTHETHAKFAAIRLLMGRYQQTRDSQYLDPIMTRLLNLLVENRQEALTEYGKDMLRGLYTYLLLLSDTDDTLWQKMRSIVFKEWDGKIYSLGSQKQDHIIMSLGSMFFIQKIDVMPHRLKNDPLLIKKIQKLALRKDNAIYGVVWLSRYLASEHSYPLLQKNLHRLNSDSKRWAGWTLSALPADYLQTQIGAADWAAQLLEGQRFIDLAIAALSMLLKLDRARFSPAFVDYVAGDHLRGTDFYRVIQFVKENGLREFRDHLIQFAEGPHADIGLFSNRTLEMVDELLTEWGMPRVIKTTASHQTDRDDQATPDHEFLRSAGSRLLGPILQMGFGVVFLVIGLWESYRLVSASGLILLIIGAIRGYRIYRQIEKEFITGSPFVVHTTRDPNDVIIEVTPVQEQSESPSAYTSKSGFSNLGLQLIRQGT